MRPQEFANLPPPAPQSNALPTELILPKSFKIDQNDTRLSHIWIIQINITAATIAILLFDYF